jgi:hypothetical protein
MEGFMVDSEKRLVVARTTTLARKLATGRVSSANKAQAPTKRKRQQSASANKAQALIPPWCQALFVRP